MSRAAATILPLLSLDPNVLHAQSEQTQLPLLGATADGAPMTGAPSPDGSPPATPAA